MLSSWYGALVILFRREIDVCYDLRDVNEDNTGYATFWVLVASL